MPESLLDATFLRKLERFSLSARRPFPGQMKGEKRSTRRGASVEFADYREYLPGDDLRYVDWNTAARLGKLFIKLFLEEEDLYVALLVDTSASMGFGEPTKLRCAAQVAAALGYIGAANFDRVAVSAFAGGRTELRRPVRGRSGAIHLLDYLGGLTAGGGTSIADSMHAFASHTRSKGVAVVVSDFLDPGWQGGVKPLLARGFQVVLVHVMDREELEPTLVGDLRIIDSETGEDKEMSVTPALLSRYREAVGAFCNGLRAMANRYGMDYLMVRNDISVDDVLFGDLRRLGLVR